MINKIGEQQSREVNKYKNNKDVLTEETVEQEVNKETDKRSY